MTRSTSTRSRRPSAQASGGTSPGPRTGAVLALVAAVAMVATGIWWWLYRGDGLVDKTLDIERSLLAGETSGREGRRAVDEIIRNVDRMGPDELRQVQETLDAEWNRTRKEDIEAYFAAEPDDRRSILDRSIDRALMYKELQFAVNPRAWSKDGRRSRKPRAAPRDAQATGAASAAEKAAQRQLLERYDDALRQRARERRIELPSWQ